MDDLISIDNQIEHDVIVDRIFTITKFEPKITVKSESEFNKEIENIQNQIDNLTNRLNEIKEILK